MKIWGKDNSEKGKAWRKKRDQRKKGRLARMRRAESLQIGLVITRLECPKCGEKFFGYVNY